MAAVHGTYRDGKVELDAPADWPEGTRVVVRHKDEPDTIGIREEDWDDSPEGVAAWLKWFDSLEPILSEKEEAKFKEVLERQKAEELARSAEHHAKLRKLFE